MIIAVDTCIREYLSQQAKKTALTHSKEVMVVAIIPSLEQT